MTTCNSNIPACGGVCGCGGLIAGYTDLQIGHGGLYNSVGNYGSDFLKCDLFDYLFFTVYSVL